MHQSQMPARQAMEIDPRIQGCSSRALTGNTAMLFVTKPKPIPVQVLRPMEYKFTNQFIEDLTDPRNDSRFAADGAPYGNRAGRYAFAGQQQSLLTSIQPKSNGIVLDTARLSEFWNFVLAIDNDPSNGSASTRYPKTRQLISGYFLDEPVLPSSLGTSNQIHNPNARMVFTHNTLLKMQAAYTNAPKQVVTTSYDRNIVPNITGYLPQGNDRDLYTMTPGEQRSGMLQYPMESMVEPDGCVSTFHDSRIDPQLDRHVALDTKLDAPNNHLSHLLHSVDLGIDHQGIDATFQDHNCGASCHDPYGMPPDQTFLSKVDSNLLSTHVIEPMHGIDTSRSMLLGELDAKFPEIQMHQFNDMSDGFEARPQQVQSMSNTMSTMVASTIAAIAASCNLVSVGFTYSSNYGNPMDIDKGLWEWKGDQINTMVPVNRVAQKEHVNQFKLSVMSQLFPILKAFQGDFWLSCTHISDTTTIVELQYADLEREYGYFVTNNRMGGMRSPLVGRYDDINNNALNLTNMMINLHGRSEYPAGSIVDNGIAGNWREDLPSTFGSGGSELSSIAPVIMNDSLTASPVQDTIEVLPTKATNKINKGLTGF